jgi:GDP-4-dehydro-6-deoxy-D-mannose reductase
VRLIFASSAEVYGRAFLDGACDEETPPQPVSSYGRTKLAGEFLLRDLAGPALEVVTLRLFNHTGRGQDTRFVVPGFAEQIAHLERIKGDGTLRVGNLASQRDFSHVEDVIDAYLTVLGAPRRESDFSLYNVGSGMPRSIQSVLDALLGLSRKKIAIELDPARFRPSEIPVAQGLFSRFTTDYGWRPTRGFETALIAVLEDRRARLG